MSRIFRSGGGAQSCKFFCGRHLYMSPCLAVAEISISSIWEMTVASVRRCFHDRQIYTKRDYAGLSRETWSSWWVWPNAWRKRRRWENTSISANSARFIKWSSIRVQHTRGRRYVLHQDEPGRVHSVERADIIPPWSTSTGPCLHFSVTAIHDFMPEYRIFAFLCSVSRRTWFRSKRISLSVSQCFRVRVVALTWRMFAARTRWKPSRLSTTPSWTDARSRHRWALLNTAVISSKERNAKNPYVFHSHKTFVQY